MHLPAAAQWILIAAEEIHNAATAQKQRATTGPLWEARGGTERFDSDRWLFWQHGFGELAESDGLDDETKGAARIAGDRMAALTLG